MVEKKKHVRENKKKSVKISRKTINFETLIHRSKVFFNNISMLILRIFKSYINIAGDGS